MPKRSAGSQKEMNKETAAGTARSGSGTQNSGTGGRNAARARAAAGAQNSAGTRNADENRTRTRRTRDAETADTVRTRARRTRDTEAAETIRTMRAKDAERRDRSTRERRRREAQMRSHVTMISALIIGIIVITAALFGMQTLRESEKARALAAQTAETGADGQISADGMGKNDSETGDAQNGADAAKAGKMSGGIAYVKIKANDPDDVDGDGVPNQEDIFQSAKEYVATKPVYEDRYYQNGFPDDGYGVCTDVIGFAFLGAGFNLQMLVKSDIEQHIEEYPEMETPDPKIDFRRVKNLDVFFRHTAEVLPTSLDDLSVWEPGDIVTWERHIGIISDKKNERGVPYVIHHAGVSQTEYEEDILEGKSRYTYVREITGHYRVR